MSNVRAPPPTSSQVAEARRLMDPLSKDPPLDLHQAAEQLGISFRDLDRELWRNLGVLQ